METNTSHPFQVYFGNGVRIFAIKTAEGHKLVKYNFNLPLAFHPTAKSVEVKAEFLRNGRVWTDITKMYKYLIKFKKHSIAEPKQIWTITKREGQIINQTFAKDPWNPRIY